MTSESTVESQDMTFSRQLSCHLLFWNLFLAITYNDCTIRASLKAKLVILDGNVFISKSSGEIGYDSQGLPTFI
jgi:hypothetical protein